MDGDDFLCVRFLLLIKSRAEKSKLVDCPFIDLGS